jgi:hypothetical protein
MKKSWIISSIVATVSIFYILCVALGYMEGDDIMQGSALLLTILFTWIFFNAKVRYGRISDSDFKK